MINYLKLTNLIYQYWFRNHQLLATIMWSDLVNDFMLLPMVQLTFAFFILVLHFLIVFLYDSCIIWLWMIDNWSFIESCLAWRSSEILLCCTLSWLPLIIKDECSSDSLIILGYLGAWDLDWLFINLYISSCSSDMSYFA